MSTASTQASDDSTHHFVEPRRGDRFHQVIPKGAARIVAIQLDWAEST